MLFPSSNCKTTCSTVSVIPPSSMTSFTEDARAIISTAGSIATAPCRKLRKMPRRSLLTIAPQITPAIKKLAARIGIA